MDNNSSVKTPFQVIDLLFDTDEKYNTLTKKDKEELQELESKIGSMPTAENPVDIRAMDIIRRAAQYLEQ